MIKMGYTRTIRCRCLLSNWELLVFRLLLTVKGAASELPVESSEFLWEHSTAKPAVAAAVTAPTLKLARINCLTNYMGQKSLTYFTDKPWLCQSSSISCTEEGTRFGPLLAMYSKLSLWWLGTNELIQHKPSIPSLVLWTSPSSTRFFFLQQWRSVWGLMSRFHVHTTRHCDCRLYSLFNMQIL